MKLRRFLVAGLLAGSLMGAVGGVAGAAPANARTETFPITCDGEMITITVVTVANGKETPVVFAPAFTADGRVLIPVEFHFVFTTPDGQVFRLDKVKGNVSTAQAGRLTTCTFSETQDGFTFGGTAIVRVAGKQS